MPCPLPNELILQILSDVIARDDLRSVRLASRSFSNLTAPSLFTILKIGAGFGNPKNSALGQYVNGLHLSFPLEFEWTHSTSTQIKKKFQLMLHRLSATRRQHGHERTIEMLHLAVPLLAGLAHIRIENTSSPCHPECSRVDEHTRSLNQFLLRLSHIPNLRSASFFARPDPRVLSLSSFTDLRKLAIEWHAMAHSDGISRFISSNRHLEDLTVAVYWRIDDLSPAEPVSVCVDDVLPSPLRRLTRLQLNNVDAPPGSISDNVLKSLSQLERLSLQWMVPSDEFWIALGRANVQLLSLSLCDVPVTNAVIDYLALCTALTSIHVMTSRNEYDCGAGRAFWTRILPVHALRIVDLAITGSGQWSLHDEDIDTLAQCYAMEHLCVHVPESRVSVEGETNIVRCLLQLIFLGVWPRMSVLSILSVASEVVPGFRTRLEQHRINRIIEDVRFTDNGTAIRDSLFGVRIHSIGSWYRLCRLGKELRFIRTGAVQS
ncbi:hypothetical protein BDZ89DRAFT_1074794 [Hymenopellis radicata]|nr:hypothetical protein BDZ89DRAFT_1074794 [Hymenopellis radicata]